jgi:predicted MFS family arabinose efflux permease
LATLNHAFRSRSRDAIATLTLFGGFASTVFWPLTAKLDAQFGWRSSYLILGAVQILLCAPMHLLMQPKASKHHDPVCGWRRQTKRGAGCPLPPR